MLNLGSLSTFGSSYRQRPLISKQHWCLKLCQRRQECRSGLPSKYHPMAMLLYISVWTGNGVWLLVTQSKLESCKSTELIQAINFVLLCFLDALISFAFPCQCSLLLEILCLFCFPYNEEQLSDYPIHK